MKTIIAAVLTCIVLFAGSYGASVYFSQPVPEEDVASEATTSEESPEPTAMLPEDSTAEKTSLPMQVSNRPDQSVSLEAVLQMSDSVRKMEEKLIMREQVVSKEEQRVQMLFNDLKTERNRIQSMSESVDAKVRQLGLMAENLNATLAQLESRKAEVSKLEQNAGVDDASKQEELDAKVNDVKAWFSNLAPEQSSEYLKEFANNGKLEFAASLLQKMPDRQKSKILGALSDPVLVEQLIDALRVKPKTP